MNSLSFREEQLTVTGILMIVIGAVLLLTGIWVWCTIRRKVAQNHNIIHMKDLSQRDLNEQPLIGKSEEYNCANQLGACSYFSYPKSVSFCLAALNV